MIKNEIIKLASKMKNKQVCHQKNWSKLIKKEMNFSKNKKID
jgi:hypothetical protein